MTDDTSVDTSTSEDIIFDNNGIYIPQNWQDTLEQFTVFSPERMNHIEQGIKKNSEKIKENWDSISQRLRLKVDLPFNLQANGSMSVSSVVVPIPNGYSAVSIAGFDIWEGIAATRLDIQVNKVFYQLINVTNTPKTGNGHVWLILERCSVVDADV